MHGVPARAVFENEVRAGEFGQQGPHHSWGEAGKAGGGGGGDIWTGVNAEEAEDPRGCGGEPLVGPREDGSYVAGGLFAGQRVKAVRAVTQLVGEGVEAELRVNRGAGPVRQARVRHLR